MKKNIVFEKDTLLASLPDGRFITITHETVIRRLMEANNVTLQRCIPAYMKNLLSIQDKMLGCKYCRKKQTCGLRRFGSKPRQFYYVEFNKKREEQLNPVR